LIDGKPADDTNQTLVTEKSNLDYYSLEQRSNLNRDSGIAIDLIKSKKATLNKNNSSSKNNILVMDNLALTQDSIDIQVEPYSQPQTIQIDFPQFGSFSPIPTSLCDNLNTHNYNSLYTQNLDANLSKFTHNNNTNQNEHNPKINENLGNIITPRMNRDSFNP